MYPETLNRMDNEFLIHEFFPIRNPLALSFTLRFRFEDRPRETFVTPYKL